MPGLTEAQEQAIVVRALKRSKVLFCAVPNGGHRSGRGGASLRSQGVQKGVPDLLIFDRSPLEPVTHGFLHVSGIALEMKRARGKPSDVTPEQRQWLGDLEARGWVALVGYGADDALVKLRALGLDV